MGPKWTKCLDTFCFSLCACFLFKKRTQTLEADRNVYTVAPWKFWGARNIDKHWWGTSFLCDVKHMNAKWYLPHTTAREVPNKSQKLAFLSSEIRFLWSKTLWRIYVGLGKINLWLWFFWGPIWWWEIRPVSCCFFFSWGAWAGLAYCVGPIAITIFSVTCPLRLSSLVRKHSKYTLPENRPFQRPKRKLESEPTIQWFRCKLLVSRRETCQISYRRIYFSCGLNITDLIWVIFVKCNHQEKNQGWNLKKYTLPGWTPRTHGKMKVLHPEYMGYNYS